MDRAAAVAAAAAADRRPSRAPAADAAPAICRICRGEGTAAEPLFYPCKCSGSIKFVHQDCLMEWLSHSQKKYCELCKTSFRFTKLYAPDMPKSLPVHVFLEHMARYLMRNLLVWLRALVSVSVWVCWLPWFMRSVWSFMFWISDEGLGSASILSRNDTADASAWLSATLAGVGTCPATPLLPATTTSAAEAAVMLKGLDSEDMSEYLVRILLGSWGTPVKIARPGIPLGLANASMPAAASNASLVKSASLLGDVDFLKRLTPSPLLNRTIISVLEGQIITILVIVCFILVILVRDYVVQQQPDIHLRQVFEEPENDAMPVDEAAQEQAPAVQMLREAAETESEGGVPDDGVSPATGPAQPSGPESAPIPEESPAKVGGSLSIVGQVPGQLPLPDLPSNRPVRRGSVGHDDNTSDRSSVIDYLQIYRRAGGDSERILQIVEEEGLEEQLSYWVNVTRRSITKREDVARDLARSLNTEPDARPELWPHEGSSADGIHRATPEPDSGSRNISKGKEKAREPASPGASLELLAGPSRPRAVSDGPPLHSSDVNPLGSNNWSFSDLPQHQDANAAGPELPASSVENGVILLTDDIAADGSHGGLAESEHGQFHHHEVDEEVDALLQPHLEPDSLAGQLPAPGQRHAAGLFDRVANFMWGDLDEHQHDHDADEDDDDDDEDGWIDIPMGEDHDDADAVDADGAAPGAGMDQEAMEDMEDFEGVMELIGMRGPIAGLFQNAIFCAVLVSLTIFVCIFIPYNIGRIAVWVMANPMQLVRMLLQLSKVVQDASVMVGGLFTWCALNLADLFTGIISSDVQAKIVIARKASWVVWTTALTRVMDYFVVDFPFSATEMQNFSAVSHEALNSVKGAMVSAIDGVGTGFASLISMALNPTDGKLLTVAAAAATSASASIRTVVSLALDPSSWVIDLGGAGSHASVDAVLSSWSGLDRFWAILAGYITIFTISAMYLKRGAPFSRGNMLQAWEAGVIDTLHQASGIMKVILIISIEMLVFPLYCGLLLDIALLPLFEDMTVRHRVLFTYNYPLTSVFVHWFVGTGYMFHFALFVSMCRKIMRPGVLYFIRDPDDPEFHPVRDVLERNLTTQLRKILFSAFVYGTLVIVCLGGVVWGLSYSLSGVLPIHYSSNEPVLEFPVDLLFYNFLMPLAVQVFKPGDALHTMYTWWFRKCARGLRLTYFLFGERRIDEEGTLRLPADSPKTQPRYRSLLLELDEHNRVVPKTWRDTFEGGYEKPNPVMSSREERMLRRRKQYLVASGQLVKSGRFVRAPASDRVKIPKGMKVFLAVSESGRRKDGNADDDYYASDHFQMVYVPPNFRARIFLFILFIWLFAAVTGVGITIVPLALGRAMFKHLIPEGIRTNDVYAFSIGMYVLGTLVYATLRMRAVAARARAWAAGVWDEVAGGKAGSRISAGLLRGAKLSYAYFVLLVVFPLLFSTLMELYVSIPLHTYMKAPTAASSKAGGHGDRHTIRVIQAWTLGILYLNLGSRMVTSLFPDSRAATAVRSVLRRGWQRPDIRLLTRAFVVPGTAVAAAAIVGPPLLAKVLMQMDVVGGAADEAKTAMVYRYSYPAAAVAAGAVRHAVGMAAVFKGWKAGIRDEAYLIGERLHNFGAATAGTRRAQKAWASGRPRL